MSFENAWLYSCSVRQPSADPFRTEYNSALATQAHVALLEVDAGFDAALASLRHRSRRRLVMALKLVKFADVQQPPRRRRNLSRPRAPWCGAKASTCGPESGHGPQGVSLLKWQGTFGHMPGTALGACSISRLGPCVWLDTAALRGGMQLVLMLLPLCFKLLQSTD